jgi:hypothetical protein
MNRLACDDPKYHFRYNNIIEADTYFEEAFESLSKRDDTIVKVDADQDVLRIGEIAFNAIIDRGILNRKVLQSGKLF